MDSPSGKKQIHLTSASGFQHEKFESMFGPDYDPTFEVFLTTRTERVDLKVQDQDGNEVWKRHVSLEGTDSFNFPSHVDLY